MKKADLFDSFIKLYRADQVLLLEELRSCPPTGTMRLWAGSSPERLRDITNQRISAIRREHARIQAAIDFASAVAKTLRKERCTTAAAAAASHRLR